MKRFPFYSLLFSHVFNIDYIHSPLPPATPLTLPHIYFPNSYPLMTEKFARTCFSLHYLILEAAARLTNLIQNDSLKLS